MGRARMPRARQSIGPTCFLGAAMGLVCQGVPRKTWKLIIFITVVVMKVMWSSKYGGQ